VVERAKRLRFPFEPGEPVVVVGDERWARF